MAFTDNFSGEIASELHKQLITISAKAWGYRNTAKQLVTLIESIRTTMKEIQYSGVELPSHRQAEICMLFEKLEKGKKLTEKILSSRQWNLYQKLTLARKMEKLEKTISSFLKAELFTNKVGDVHHLRGDSNVWQSSSSSSSSSFNDSLMTRSREFPDRISFREMDLSKAGPSGTLAMDRENTVELELDLGHSVSLDGDIFSVSEASLLDQEIQAQEYIQQLEAEIATYFSQLQHHNMMSSSSSSVDSESIYSLITHSMEFPDRVSFRKMDLSEAGPSSRDSISFRIRGVEGEMDRIDLSRGVFGPEDLVISFDDWEAYKKRSSSNVVNRFKSFELDSHKVHSQELREAGCSGAVVASILTNRDITELTFSDSRENGKLSTLANKEIADGGTEKNKPSIERKPSILVKSNGYFVPNDVVTVDGGIKGVRPPVLKPPPSMNWPHIDLHGSSWDLTSSTPSSENGCVEEEAREEELEMEGTGAMLGDKADESCSFTTDEDETSSTVSNTSPIYASGGSIITSWQKGQLLGQGSFGSVYEGISGDGDFFAVKEVSLLDQGSQAKECIQQLEGEIKLLSQLQHQNIVRYRGTAKDESNLYIFLELVTQGSLLKLYQRYQLRYSVVSMYTRQILDGLKYLHDKGFIHRDIKCANILVDSFGFVNLADFGLAKVLKDIKSCVGKPFWMAPEVINPRSKDEYGSPADIWSLGCTVLEMCTGQIPYSDLEPVQALFKIGMGVLPEIPETISQDARDFILKCLKVNPDKRPTAAELLNHPFVRRPCVGESRYESW